MACTRTVVSLRSMAAGDAIRSFAVLVDCMANKWALPRCGDPGHFLGRFLSLERGMDPIHYWICQGFMLTRSPSAAKNSSSACSKV